MNEHDVLDTATADDFVARFDHLTLDRPTPTIETPAPSRQRSRSRLVAAAAAVAVLAGATIVSLAGDDNEVYALWSPVPRAASSAELAAVTDVCNDRMLADSEGPGQAVFGSGSHHEVRGRTAMLLDARVGGGYHLCVASVQDGTWVVFRYGSVEPLGAHDPWLEGGGGPDTFAWFMVGESAEAVSVELDLPGHPMATAPVVGGTYLLWWPEDGTVPGPTEGVPGPRALDGVELRLLDGDGTVVQTISW